MFALQSRRALILLLTSVLTMTSACSPTVDASAQQLDGDQTSRPKSVVKPLPRSGHAAKKAVLSGTPRNPNAAGERKNKECWWVEIGEGSLAAVWLSPRMEGAFEGGYRFLNMIFHEPESKQQMSLQSRVIRRRSSRPIRVLRNHLRFVVAPTDGKMWDDVRCKDDLAVELVRI